MRPTGMSPISWRGAPQTGAGPSDTTRDEQMDLDMVKEDLMHLTVPIPYTRDEDIPIRMHHHTSGGGGLLTQLVCKVAQVVACYSEHQHDD